MFQAAASTDLLFPKAGAEQNGGVHRHNVPGAKFFALTAEVNTVAADKLIAGFVDTDTGTLSDAVPISRPKRAFIFQNKRGPLPLGDGRMLSKALETMRKQLEKSLVNAHGDADIKVIDAS